MNDTDATEQALQILRSGEGLRRPLPSACCIGFPRSSTP